MSKVAYIYCICRVNRKYYSQINVDLKDRGYRNIKAIIPVIHLLKKSRKGQDTFEEIPLLFNYGFIKMEPRRAYNRNFLNKLGREIPGIQSWVRSLESLHPKKKKKRIDNVEIFDDFSVVATITKEEVKSYQKLAANNHIHTLSDIEDVNPGDYVTLRGYPFEGMAATIEDINLTTRQATIIIHTNGTQLTTKVPMDNVLYSIYSDYNEYDLKSPDYEVDLSTIPEGSEEQLLTNKQF